jgi:tetratricopeptide (TPR) repeat protein
MSAALSRTERAHGEYRDGHYAEALKLYSSALSVAKRGPHRIALHSNRAACYLKLQNYKEAADECSAVLELDPKHASALMLRAQTLVALKDYHSALFDVNRLLELDPSSQVYRGLQARLKTQLSLSTITEEDEEEEGDEEEPNSPSSIDKEAERESESFMTMPPTADENNPQPVGWDAIPKPQGHSKVNYSKWDSMANDLSSDEEEDDDEPQYTYRFKAVNFVK